MSQSYRVVMLTQARRREVEREFPLTCIKCYHAPAGLAIRVRSQMLIVACDELIGCERVSREDARCGSTPVQRSRGNDRPLAVTIWHDRTNPTHYPSRPGAVKKSGRRNDRFRTRSLLRPHWRWRIIGWLDPPTKGR